MATILDAAKWMNAGYIVKRTSCSFTATVDIGNALNKAFGIIDIECDDGGHHELSTDDLLADNWEIA